MPVAQLAGHDRISGEPALTVGELVLYGQVLIKGPVNPAHEIEPANVIGRPHQDFVHQGPFRPDMGGAQLLGITPDLILGIILLHGRFDVQDRGLVPFDQIGIVAVEKSQSIAQGLGRFRGNPPLQGRRGHDDLLGQILDLTQAF